MAFNPWHLPFVDLYALVRPLIFLFDSETGQRMTVRMLGFGLGPRAAKNENDAPILRSELFGLTFNNPVGLAAGLDKQAEAIDGCFNLGFGFIELGGVTPLPQQGNPKPRMWRVPQQEAVINFIGLESVGIDVFTKRLRRWWNKPSRVKRPIAINLAKNKTTEDDAADFVIGLKNVAPYCDMVVLNVSCPNVTGVCNLQNRDQLANILKQVTEVRDQVKANLPVLVKMSPHLNAAETEDIVAAVKANSIQGIIVSNTHNAPDNYLNEKTGKPGGLSGVPLFASSTEKLREVYKLTEGKIPLIGTGGISSGEDAYAKIRAGASLLQLYTSLVYKGPGVVPKINEDLAALLQRDGFKSIGEAIGADHKSS